MNAAERAAHHADQAQQLLERGERKLRNPSVEARIERASQATAHATLAVYWQHEAERGQS